MFIRRLVPAPMDRDTAVDTYPIDATKLTRCR